MTDFEFEQWFNEQWAKVTEELKQYDLSKIYITDGNKVYAECPEMSKNVQ